MSGRYKNACITWNNPDGQPKWNPSVMSYLVYEKEKGELGTVHWQIYVEFAKQVSLKQIKSMFDDKVHVEKRYGSARQAADYCMKGGIEPWVEHGVISRQGLRTDLKELTDKLKSGDTTLDDIAVEDPHTFHMYGRTLEKIVDITNKKDFVVPRGTFLFNTSGDVRKWIATQLRDKNQYLWDASCGWEGYTGQETVWINGDDPKAFDFIRKVDEDLPIKVKKNYVGEMWLRAKEIIVYSRHNDCPPTWGGARIDGSKMMAETDDDPPAVYRH